MPKSNTVRIKPSGKSAGTWLVKLEREFEISKLHGTRIEQGCITVEAMCDDKTAARIHTMLCKENGK